MSGGEIATLIGALVGIHVTLWLLIRNRLRKRLRALVEALRRELRERGEPAVLGPQSRLYRGALHQYGKTPGNGAAVLTERRVVLGKLIGARIDIPLSRLARVSAETWHLGRSAWGSGGERHIVPRARRQPHRFSRARTGGLARRIERATDASRINRRVFPRLL